MVGADVEPAAIVVDLVLVAAGAGLEHLESAVGPVRVEDPVLGRHRLRRRDQQVPLRPALAHLAVERLVRLLVDQDVLGLRGPQRVPPDPVPAQRLGMQARVEEGAVVVGPDEVAGHARQLVVEQDPGRQVPDADGVDAAPLEVHRVGEQPPVGTDLERRHLAEVVTFGQDVDVQKDLLPVKRRSGVEGRRGINRRWRVTFRGRIHRCRRVKRRRRINRRGHMNGHRLVSRRRRFNRPGPIGRGRHIERGRRVDRPPAVDGVLAPVLVAGAVEVRALPVRHRHVGLLDAPLDLGEQGLLQRLGRRHHRPHVVVLGLEIGGDGGVAAPAQPVVVVDPHHPVRLVAYAGNPRPRRGNPGG